MARMINRSIALLAVAGMLLQPVVASAQQPSPRAGRSPQVRDIELDHTGSLRGVVVDDRGGPSQGTTIQLRQRSGVVGVATSLKDGSFRVAGLQGGVYEIATDRPIGTCRLWSAGTAPPTARQAILLVDRSETVRGQLGRAASLQTLGAIALWGGLVYSIIEIVDSDAS